MDGFSQYSSESESGSARAVHLSDEEILLASRNPKKRSGRKKFKETRHPVYRGVRRRNSDKWVCEVREPSKQARIWLGTFPTAEMAARAHDVAAIALRGRSACLNFAESACMQVHTSGDPKEIQRMAAEAAEKFRPEPAKVAEKRESSESVFFMDGEAVFGMPGLLTNMAEGMLLPPPYYFGDDGSGGDDMEANADVSLWSYSI